jgi:hypothetical protein
MDFMVYAHLQLGQDGEAKRLLEESAALYKTQAPTAQLTPTGGVLTVHTAFAAIPARYAIERGAWADAAALQPRPTTPAADAITHFTRAMGAVRQGDVNRARKDIEQLESAKNTLMKSKQKYWADQVEIQRRAAVAWVAQAEGKKNEALKLMRSAAALEDASEKHVAMENRLWPLRSCRRNAPSGKRARAGAQVASLGGAQPLPRILRRRKGGRALRRSEEN